MIYPGLLLQERYLVVKRLGKGGFCETWKVDDRGTPKVLKVLQDNYPKIVELFQREAEVLKQLNHPGIPKVEPDGYFTLELEGMTEPLHCLVMEFIEGQNLQEWLEKQNNQPITQEQALAWLKQLVEILAQVHEQQYFHRDIKPSNIMRRSDGQLVLIDFGTARKLTASYVPKREIEAITRIYSAGYTAPEQFRGQAVPQSDFFALGRTLVYLLTAKEPIEFEEHLETFELKQDWRCLAPQVSKPLVDLIDDMMAPSQKKRPQNVQIILQRLAMLSLEDSVRSHIKYLPEPLKLLAEPFLKLNLLWQQKTRVPQIGLYGRSGSGKSSLINAIMGKQVAKIDDVKPGTLVQETYDKEQNGWKLRFVDSRGVGDSPSEDALKQAINDIVKERIDVLLFVIPANDRAVSSDYNFLRALKAAHQKKYGTELLVILVINKIDLMPPMGEWKPDYNLNLDSQAVLTLKEAKIHECIKFRIEQYQNLTKRYVPVCALWNDCGDDRRYNIDELAQKIYDCIPDEAKPGFAGATAATSVKKNLANTLIGTLALVAGLICFVPIPFLDALTVTYIQVNLVNIIAQIASNNEDQKETATKFISDLGVYGVVGNTSITILVQQVAKIIPGIGAALNAGTAAIFAALTTAIGAAAVGRFIEGISMEEAKQRYDELHPRLREEFQKAFTGGTNEREKAENIAEKLHGLPNIFIETPGGSF